MNDSSPTSAARPGAGAPAGLDSTTLDRQWLIRIIPIILLVLGFAVWALADALWVYPARGARAASYLELQYLREWSRGNKVTPPGVHDPRADRRTLEGRVDRSTFDQARLDWLDALATIGRLKPEFTAIPRGTSAVDPKVEAVRDVNERIAALEKLWSTPEGQPVRGPDPLNSYDIPFQWLILVLCGGIGIYLLVSFVRAVTSPYRFDHATLTLHVPGGATLRPSDLQDVDKRDWSKYLIYLQIKPDVPRIGGTEMTMRVGRYLKLEDWINAMERAAFPERAQEAVKDAGADGAAASPGSPESPGSSAPPVPREPTPAP